MSFRPRRRAAFGVLLLGCLRSRSFSFSLPAEAVLTDGRRIRASARPRASYPAPGRVRGSWPASSSSFSLLRGGRLLSPTSQPPSSRPSAFSLLGRPRPAAPACRSSPPRAASSSCSRCSLPIWASSFCLAACRLAASGELRSFGRLLGFFGSTRRHGPSRTWARSAAFLIAGFGCHLLGCMSFIFCSAASCLVASSFDCKSFASLARSLLAGVLAHHARRVSVRPASCRLPGSVGRQSPSPPARPARSHLWSAARTDLLRHVGSPPLARSAASSTSFSACLRVASSGDFRSFASSCMGLLRGRPSRSCSSSFFSAACALLPHRARSSPSPRRPIGLLLLRGPSAPRPAPPSPAIFSSACLLLLRRPVLQIVRPIFSRRLLKVFAGAHDPCRA